MLHMNQALSEISVPGPEPTFELSNHAAVKCEWAVLPAIWRDFALAISPRPFALFRCGPFCRQRGENSKLAFKLVQPKGIMSGPV